jgi:TatD DNase family protein
MSFWIDTHCHLDAPELAPDLDQVHARALAAGVRQVVLPAVAPGNFAAVRELARRFSYSYALGIHPLCVPEAGEGDVRLLQEEVRQRLGDPRFVAIGEIGLDYFVPELMAPAMRDKQARVYRAQLGLACDHGLPVLLHVRRSADMLLKYLRQRAPAGGWRGIAHAFNGSEQQAAEFIKLGFKLGFGGAVTFDAARQLRKLASSIPLESLVLETDAPDIPPQWLYVTSAHRLQGQPQGRNEPAQIPRIAEVVARLRGMPVEALAQAAAANAWNALPRLRALAE